MQFSLFKNKRTLVAATLAIVQAVTLHAATLAGGASQSIAMRADGKVFSWGYNYYGALGTGSTNNAYTPQNAQFFSGAKAIAAGGNHTLVLNSDNTVWSWGTNYNGQLGKGDTTSSSTPVQVQYLQNVSAIAAGSTHSLALKADGTVWAWGSNNYGQLALSSGDKSAPLQIASLSNVIAIAASDSSSYALKSDGTLWAWGYNYNGELGNGSTSQSSVPVQVAGATSISAIAAGSNHVVALKQNGTILTWGDNSYCQLGNSTNNYGSCQDSTAANAVANLTDVTAVAASQYDSMVLKSDGSVWAWGSNYNGQLGNGSQTGYGKVSLLPVQVTGLSNIREIGSTRGQHFLARKATGEVYAWGLNEYGQLGNNQGGRDSNYSSYIAATPVQVVGPGGDGTLNLVTTEVCKGTATVTTAFLINYPCVTYAGVDYQLQLMLDSSITSGTYFKMMSIGPR